MISRKIMASSKCDIFHRHGISFPSFILLCSLFSICSAALTTYYMEELCYGWSDRTFDLRNRRTGILASFSGGLDVSECTLRLKPELKSSVVLSIYRYNVGPEDQLIIEDSNQFRVALIGEGDFPDERKSFLSDGPMTISYFRSRNNTRRQTTRLNFQFIFTQVHGEPCSSVEFQCGNRKCVPRSLLCDRHNHCGDNSDQEDCGRKKNEFKTTVTVKTQSAAWVISIIVCASIVLIVVIVFIAVVASRAAKKKKSAGALPTATIPAGAAPQPSVFARFRQSLRGLNHQAAAPPADGVAATPPHHPDGAQPSVFARFRQSLRGLTAKGAPVAGDGGPKSDNYEVPSMYPQLPSAPHLPGVDNPDFKADDA